MNFDDLEKLPKLDTEFKADEHEADQSNPVGCTCKSWIPENGEHEDGCMYATIREQHPHRGIHFRQDSTNTLLAMILKELRDWRKQLMTGMTNLESAVDSAVSQLQSNSALMESAANELASWLNSGSPTDQQLQALADKLNAGVQGNTQSVTDLTTAETTDAPPSSTSTAPVAPVDLGSQTSPTSTDPDAPVTTGAPSLDASATATVPDSPTVTDNTVTSTPAPAPTGFDQLAGGASS